MRALISDIVGGSETLEMCDVEEPKCGPGQLLVRVRASGINFPDSLIIRDLYQVKASRPFSPGSEFAGIVEAVGAGVTAFNAGDRVLGFCTWGALAEKLVIDAGQCAVIPDDMPFDVAAAFGITYGTAHYALSIRGGLSRGDTLLVLGAAGGVGTASVQLGKALGARVVAAVSSEEKGSFARSKGADDVVVYPTGPLSPGDRSSLGKMFRDACGPHGADVICDGVGGDYSEAAFRTIAPEGRHLVIGFPAGIPKLPLNLPLVKSADIVGIFWAAWLARKPGRFTDQFADLFRLFREGWLKPHISARFALEQGGDAIDYVSSRRALGKVVVEIAETGHSAT